MISTSNTAYVYSGFLHFFSVLKSENELIYMLFLSIFVLKEGRGTDGEDYYISLHTMKRNVLEKF